MADSGRQLVSTAREYVHINRVYCDRELYRVHLVKTFKELNEELVMRVSKTRGIHRRIEENDADRYITEYKMVRKNPPISRTLARLVVVLHRTREDDHFCLVTPLELDTDAVEFAESLAEAYRRRWGIEISYQKVGEFLPRTSSPMFSVRLFYFRFAVALYNP